MPGIPAIAISKGFFRKEEKRGKKGLAGSSDLEKVVKGLYPDLKKRRRWKKEKKEMGDRANIVDVDLRCSRSPIRKKGGQEFSPSHLEAGLA